MIDTCGLPMKFEFSYHGTHYIVDFYQADERGYPLLTNLSFGTTGHDNAPKRYSTMFERGIWKFLHEIIDVDPVQVEDLL